MQSFGIQEIASELYWFSHLCSMQAKPENEKKKPMSTPGRIQKLPDNSPTLATSFSTHLSLPFLTVIKACNSCTN